VTIYGLPALLLLGLVPYLDGLRKIRMQLIYLIFFLALGPGLLVHTALKEHLGRARPNQVTQFGGKQPFSAAWIPSTACAHNCSFVSGHAAMGFFPLGLAFAFPRRRRLWLNVGIAAGTIAGLSRVAQGAHFLSDVVFAGFVVYGSAWWLDRWVLAKQAHENQPANCD
jgi:lipid A 4'-phosphatase